MRYLYKIIIFGNMFNWIINKIAGDYNTRQLKKINPLVIEINKFYDKFDSLSNQEIQDKTQEFKQIIQTWEKTLDDILPEVFAVVKQACKRLVGTEYEVKWNKVIWDMVPYDVQLIWWIVLHQGKVAEMKTGEGKTLVATLPAYLNALSGNPVHVVTVNDYLASRDAETTGVLYEWLWMSVGSVNKFTPQHMRKSEYSKDIIYIENTELWFDYLRDNLEKSIDGRRLMNRGLHYAIVDEADSIFIDEARTPMIMSNPNNDPVDKYIYFGKVASQLIANKGKKKVSKWFLAEMIKEDNKDENPEDHSGDYYIDEKHKSATLSESGIAKLERVFNVENLYRDLPFEDIHHIENALLAKAVYQEGKDYIISGDEVLIVDENTGRTMPGRRFQSWLHQAIEAKEWVSIKNEAKTIASITYQNFFKLYNKLSGMTGTATTEAEEFEKIYNLETISIPTNKTIIRDDRGDRVYFDQKAKRNAVIDNIKFYNQIWQPILVGTSSIQTSELVSKLLNQTSTTHYVLNAKYHEQEANIIGNAGKKWWVVVATNMAWRGTDIKLEKWLDENLAENYAKWIKSEIAKWNTLDLEFANQKEYELVMSKVNE